MATDLEREIRELLSERASDVRPPADAHPTMLRRARRRRVGTAFVSSLVVAGFIAAAVVGTRALLAPSAAPERETRLGGANEEAFAVWPQTTREEAREAQACIDAGRPECMWQLNALEVVRRYAESELGWNETYVLVRGFNDEFVRLPLEGEENDIGLIDVVDPLTIDMAECPPAKDAIDQCPVGRVRVEKPLRPDVTGIWLITQSDLGGSVASESVSASGTGGGSGSRISSLLPRNRFMPAGESIQQQLDAFLVEFMDARSDGSGAEDFLAESAWRAYDAHEGSIPLYVDGTPSWSFGFGRFFKERGARNTYAVVSTIRDADGSRWQEILTIAYRPDGVETGPAWQDYLVVDADLAARSLGSTPEGSAPTTPLPAPLGDFLTAFMEARRAGDEVAPFLTKRSFDDLDWYEDVGPNTPYDFTRWSRKAPTNGWADRFIVYVRIIGSSGARSERLEVQFGGTAYAITAAASEA